MYFLVSPYLQSHQQKLALFSSFYCSLIAQFWASAFNALLLAEFQGCCTETFIVNHAVQRSAVKSIECSAQYSLVAISSGISDQ